MDKKTPVSLIACLLLLASTSSFAERPADADETTSQPAPAVSDTADSDAEMRPAAADSMPADMDSHRETSTSGDVMTMPATQTTEEAVAAPVRQLDFPRRGMTEDKVRNELGRPIEIIPPVGKPPITRWVYDDRVVYFEYSSVVHVVAK